MKYQLLGLVIRTSVILNMYLLDQKLERSLNRMGKAIGFTGVYSPYTASIGNWVCYRFPQVVDRTESDRACWVFAEVNFGKIMMGAFLKKGVTFSASALERNGQDKIQTFQSIRLKHLLQTP